MENGDMRAAIENAQTLAKYVDTLLNGAGPRNVGFSLLFFPLGEPNGTNVNYVGNCQRAEMLVALKELVARWEGQPRVKGRA